MELSLTDDQVIELVKQLSPERKRKVLLALAENSRIQRVARMEYAEEQLRQLCVERGLNWDVMGESEREEFIDDLIHEDRPCCK